MIASNMSLLAWCKAVLVRFLHKDLAQFAAQARILDRDDLRASISNVKVILISVAMIAGFALALYLNQRIFFGIYLLCVGICVFHYWGYKSQKMFKMIIPSVGGIMAIAAVVMILSITSTLNAQTQAREAAEFTAQLEQQIQADERAKEQRLLNAQPTPTPEEIERGGTDHHGVAMKMPIYYHGNTRYHKDPDCSQVQERFRPLTEFILYEQLVERKYRDLNPCSYCRAPARPHAH
jgi:hypothetical protein